jgi:hypothetical protein
MGSEAQTMGSEAQTMGSEAQTTGSEAQTMGSEPQTMGSEPQTTGMESGAAPEGQQHLAQGFIPGMGGRRRSLPRVKTLGWRPLSLRDSPVRGGWSGEPEDEPVEIRTCTHPAVQNSTSESRPAGTRAPSPGFQSWVWEVSQGGVSPPAQRAGRSQPRVEAAGRYPGSTGPHSCGLQGRENLGRDLKKTLSAFQAVVVVGLFYPGHRPSASALGWTLPARWAG